MPIAVSCPCGQSFQVRDEFAGRRGRCPACSAVVVVPATDADSVEDAFVRDALGDDPPLRPAAVTAEPPSYRPPAEVPRPAAPKRRPPRGRPARSSGGGSFSIALSPAVAGGLLTMLLCGAFFLFRLTADPPRVSIWGAVGFLFGLVAVVRGLMGHAED